MTMEDWARAWLVGYATKRPSTVRQARVHLAKIVDEFGGQQLVSVRPSQVRSWTARLKDEGYADSYVYALHNRLSQLMSDAVHDGIVQRNPCSRRTSPGGGKQRPYVATTEQVWAVHDAVPEHLQPAILLGAFVGLRVAEVCGLRVADVDFERGVIRPTFQYPASELKSETSRAPQPIATELALQIRDAVTAHGGVWVVCDLARDQVKPWQIERAVRRARAAVPGLPGEFRFHDLRHYLASLLIAAGLDIKVVQSRLRHASAMTTLNTYGHLMPDADESARAAVGAALAARLGSARESAAAENR